MKKLITGLALMSLYSFVQAVDVVSIDSISIMQKSKEGQKFTDVMKKKVESFNELRQRLQKELADMQDELQKKAAVLSKDALQEKTEALAKKEREAKRDIADQEETLSAEVQKMQFKLRKKQLDVANKICQENKWGVMIDKNTPGVLFVSDSIDKSDAVLKAIDAEYDATTKKANPATEVKKA